MGDGFDQIDRAIHRMNFPLVDLDAAGSSTAGTVDFYALLRCDVAGPVLLNQPAQSLANFVRRHFDIVVVRRPSPLLRSLDLAGDVGGPFETFGEFSFEFCLFRVHAILPES